MAITHNASTSNSLTGGTSTTFNISIVAGTDIAALVGISWLETNFEIASISTVTVAGTNATFIQLQIGSTGIVAEQYYVKGLTSGVKSVNVAWTGSSIAVNAVTGIEVMNDVDQTTPLGQISIDTGVSTSASVLVATTTTDGFVVDTICVDANVGISVTPDGSQTSRWDASVGSVPARITGRGSTKDSGASGTTMLYALSGSRDWVLAAAEFRPTAVVPPDPGKPVNVYTSYDYSEVHPDKLDRADRLPEEAAKVWTGKWRH